MSDYYDIPEGMRKAIDRYAQTGMPAGDCTMGILENDFAKALGHAHPGIVPQMKELMLYVMNEIPGNCHGSREIVEAWMESKKKSAPGDDVPV